MTTLILLRHGRSTANVAAILAGRTPGVDLDDIGRAQADRLAERLAEARIDRLVSSPLDRCRQTVAPLAAGRGLDLVVEDDLVEVDYGSWTGRKLSELVSEPLWRTVQGHPSGAVFPDGEGLAGVSRRAVAAVRRQLAEVAPDGTVLVCSHGDVIKAVLADALGLHLDGFQRIMVAPASLSVVRYSDLRPFVERINDTGNLDSLRPPPPAPPEEPETADASDGSAAGTTAPSTPPSTTVPLVATGDAVPGGETG